MMGEVIGMARILTVEQTAEKLQMSPKTTREMLRLGKLPGRKIGRAWRVSENDLELWVSVGHAARRGRYVSARGLLKRFPGSLSSADMIAEKRAEAQLEEAKLRRGRNQAEKPA